MAQPSATVQSEIGKAVKAAQYAITLGSWFGGKGQINCINFFGSGGSLANLKVTQWCLSFHAKSVEANVFDAGEAAVVMPPCALPNTSLNVLLSKSGTTGEVLAVAEKLKHYPCQTVVITKSKHSGLAKNCGHVVPLGEISAVMPG